MLTYYCPHCWAIIAENAAVCPHCGYPLEAFDTLRLYDNTTARTGEETAHP
ncbi:MAG: zinc-ribbon domain-containing protein [Anaerolineae bacterium]|nr:zinc-ribbon domain-containing protein [Anaerolineae bacterium]